MAVKTLTFKNCWVHIDDELHYLQTVFRDGATVTCVPDWVKDAETAARLGYGQGRAAVLALWREHDPLHTFLAEAQGLPYSPTLWAVAHQDDPENIPPWAQLAEEEFVMNFQKFMRCGTMCAEVEWLKACGHDLNWLQHQAQCILKD
ncbi:MAG: hypothetical protein JO316_12865 [Abitibacteriaceae bacterium]|nr:hypothetical protein [Abditibacteriaceae bacterium]